MKRNVIVTLSLVVLSLLLNVSGAYAQSGMGANVPFDFAVGTAQLPAGSYKIMVEYQSNTIMIRNSNTNAAVLSLVQRKYPGDRSQKLVFRHLGNQYFLSEIWGAKGSFGMTLRAPKLEKEELQVASGPSNAGKLVEIALK
jgi:hypothetical protein